MSQHARVILLGRLARYQASLQQIQTKWGCTLDELRARYTALGSEDYTADDDDDYLEWQWYADATDTINAQLTALSEA